MRSQFTMTTKAYGIALKGQTVGTYYPEWLADALPQILEYFSTCALVLSALCGNALELLCHCRKMPFVNCC